MFKTGDILGTESTIAGIIHYCIVFHNGNTPMIAQISPYSKTPETMRLADFLIHRAVKRVVPNENTDLTDDLIKDNVNRLKAQGTTYDLVNFNCEDFVRDVCSCQIGMNQRQRILAIIVFFLLVLGIFLLAK